MQRLNLAEAKGTIARVLGTCDSDSRVASYLNEAQQRLLNRPSKPVGSFMRYRICINESCITWPRQVRSIEAWAICQSPGIIRSEWFEFVENGIGLQDEENMPGRMLIDRGTAPTFEDITAGETDRLVRITTDVAEDAATYIWLFGHDENANWIRTQVGGSWVDGERLDLSACPQNSTNYFTRLTGVKKDTTDGMVRLYEYNDTTAAVVQALAFYEPSETLPIYRRSFIPGYQDMATCEGDDGDCDNKALTALVRLKHIPVAVDNDFLVIGNLPALKDMVSSILAREQRRHEEANMLEANATRELDGELAAYLGDGQVPAIRVDDREVWGAGGVENVV